MAAVAAVERVRPTVALLVTDAVTDADVATKRRRVVTVAAVVSGEFVLTLDVTEAVTYTRCVTAVENLAIPQRFIVDCEGRELQGDVVTVENIVENTVLIAYLLFADQWLRAVIFSDV